MATGPIPTISADLARGIRLNLATQGGGRAEEMIALLNRSLEIEVLTQEDAIFVQETIVLNSGGTTAGLGGAGTELLGDSGAVVGYVRVDPADISLLQAKAPTGSELTLDINADTTLVMSQDLAVSGASPVTINQSVSTTSPVVFSSLTLGATTLVSSILDEDDLVSDSATALATQQSIKAFVASQIGANNELSEILANGNTTGANDLIVTAGQKITTDTIDETTAASGVTIDGLVVKDSALIFDSSTTSKILDDSNTTSAILFGLFLSGDITADATMSADDGNFGAASGGEVFVSKGNFDEASLYINGLAAIQAFNFTGGTKGIRLDSTVTGITDPIRTSIGHSLISMGGNADSETDAGEIVLGVSSASDVVSDATARQAIIIGSASSTFGNFTNSVIIGGSGQTVAASDTVYTSEIEVQAAKQLRVDTIVNTTAFGGVTIESTKITGADVTFTSSGTIQTSEVAGQDFKLQAFDVDGASYTTFATLTANNTPTMDLSAAVTIGGNAILDSTDIGVSVQAFGAVLDDLNTLGAPASDGQFIVATGAGVFAYESGATVRTSLGLGTFAVENVAAVPSLTMADAANIAVNTTTGTQFATATGQKIAFHGATAIIQGTIVADPSGGATVDAEARTAIIALIDRFSAAAGGNGLIA